MHEVSLGYTLEDYLTGKTLEATTYEDLRQAIARLLVEHKGYPKAALLSRQVLKFTVQGNQFETMIDFVVLDNNSKPLLVIQFCAGEIETFVREALALARLLPDGPAPFALVTDTQQALLVECQKGQIIKQGAYLAIPTWSELMTLAKEEPDFELDSQRADREQRILYALRGLSCSCREAGCKI